MNRATIVGVMFLPLLLRTAPVAAASGSAGTPVKREVVAVVNGEEIFLDELNAAVAARHQEIVEDTPTGWTGYTGVLERLINIRLINQEARDVGLDERSEIREKVQLYREQLMIQLVKSSRLKAVTPDEDEIEGVYRDEVRRWKYRALVFEDLEAARAFRSELKAGADFSEAGYRFVREGSAAWDGDEREVREADIAPEIAAAFNGREEGSATPIIRAVNRFFVFHLTGVAYPEDPEARDRAAGKALKLKRDEVLEEFIDSLVEKHARIDRDVLLTIGKSASGDVETDTRVLARVAGEDPVLVMDLVRHLQGKFYHGEKASDYRKILESDPASVLREVLERRLLLKEARGMGIDGTDPFLESVAEYENSLVFDMYLNEFLVPQAGVPSEEELRAAYEERSGQFLLSPAVEVDSLTFDDRNNAERALASLRRGADLRWLSKNARGSMEEDVTRDVLVLDTLPRDLATLLADASPGETGLYESGDDLFKVFVVRNVPDRMAKPFEQVRPGIARELFNERLKQVIEDLATELKGISEITIYEEKLDRDPLRQNRDEH